MRSHRAPLGVQAAFTMAALLAVGACSPGPGAPPATATKGNPMSTPSIDSFTVEHREYPSERSFEDVVAAFERLVPLTDSTTLAVEVERAASADDLEAYLRAQAGPSGFMRFAVFDHGAWLAKFGHSGKIRSYVLGNPLVARTMIVHDPGVG